MNESPEHPPSSYRSKLLRILGIGFGIAVTIGATVSGGILRSPAEVAVHLQNPLLFIGIWFLGAVYALVCSVSFAELSTMMPRSGGLYIFTHRALGEYAGFVVGWADWLTSCGTVSASSLLICDIAAGLIPELQGKSVVLACILVLVFTAFQWTGVRTSSVVQGSTSFLKSLALVIVAVAAFSVGREFVVLSSEMLQAASLQQHVVPAENSESSSLWSLMVGTVLALQIVIYMYDGYYGVVYFGEEVRNPSRDIPRSMFISVCISAIIYILLNVAFVYVLPISQIAQSDFVGGAIAKRTFGASGDMIVRSLIILCELSTINAFFLFATRTLFAMSRDGLFSARATRVSSAGTPTVSLLMSTIVALLFLLSGSFEKALSILTFGVVVTYVLSFSSVFVLRWREPHVPRLYRAWGYP
ncbi:MAG: APC family permease, partial [Bacteroidota bacterium]|nr:APC family permease [Candidatus Kapabacteria bacterium]MDW8220616.1 APC family permease [Bacteroidota bacterium]